VDAGEEQMTPGGGAFVRGSGGHIDDPAPGIWLTIQACSTWPNSCSWALLNR
jgi:hypothetical protein